MVLDSLNFCLSGNFLIYPSNLNESHRFFPLITWNISCHSLLACRVSVEKSDPLYIACLFSHIASNNISLSLIFVSFITMCLSVFFFGFILPGNLCASWTWLIIFFLKLVNFSAIISSNILSGPFSLSYPFGTPIMWILVHLMLSQQSFGLFSFHFISFLFFFFCILFCSIDFHHSVFQVTYLFLYFIYSATYTF